MAISRMPVTLSDFNSLRYKSSVSKLRKLCPSGTSSIKLSATRQLFARALGYGSENELYALAKELGDHYTGRPLNISEVIASVAKRLVRQWSININSAESIALALGLHHFDACRPAVCFTHQKSETPNLPTSFDLSTVVLASNPLTGFGENPAMRILRKMHENPVMKAIAEIGNNTVAESMRQFYESPAVKAASEFRNSAVAESMRQFHESPAMKAASEFRNSAVAESMRQFHERPVVKAASEFRNSAVAESVRQFYESPAVKAASEFRDSAVAESVRQFYESPAVKAASEFRSSAVAESMRKIYESPAMKAIAEFENSPTMRAIQSANNSSTRSILDILSANPALNALDRLHSIPKLAKRLAKAEADTED